MKVLVYGISLLVNFCGDYTKAFGEQYKLLIFDGVPLCYYNIKLDEYFVLFDFIGGSGTLCVGGELNSKRVDYAMPIVKASVPNKLNLNCNVNMPQVDMLQVRNTQKYYRRLYVHGNKAFYLYILDGLTPEQIVQKLVERYK